MRPDGSPSSDRCCTSPSGGQSCATLLLSGRSLGGLRQGSFAGPEAVLAYLSRYTHRVAVSNSRLIACDQDGVTFRYKDYRRDGTDRQQVIKLAIDEFIRRFLTHVLPRGFHRIRRLRPAGRLCPQGQPCARPQTPERRRVA